MLNGVAPSDMTARSAIANSGRLDTISATVSPCLTPSLARVPAKASERSRNCDHVSSRFSPETASESG